jgi:tetratricopeptide (TPR) repeat protein
MEAACYQYGFLYSFHAILNLLVHLFKTYTLLERYAEAKEMLEFARRLIDQLLENETTLPPLHYLEGGDLNLLLAKACLRLGDREEALSHLERMVRYDLEHAAAFRGDAVAKSPLLCNVKWGTFYSIPSDRPQRLRAKLTDADLEPLQDHPRFQRLMDRVNQTINQQKMES